MASSGPVYENAGVPPTTSPLSTAELGFMIGYGCRKVCDHAGHPFTCGKKCVEYMNNLVGLDQREHFTLPQRGLKYDIVRDNKELIFLLVLVVCVLVGYMLYRKK